MADVHFFDGSGLGGPPSFSDPPTRDELDELVTWISDMWCEREARADDDKFQVLALLFAHEMLVSELLRALEQACGSRAALQVLARAKDDPERLAQAHPFIEDVAGVLSGHKLDFAAIFRQSVERLEALLSLDKDSADPS